MALRFVDPIAQYGGNTALPSQWWTSYSATGKTFQTGRFGQANKALRAATTGLDTNKDLGVNAPTIVWGFSFRPSTLPGSFFNPIAVFQDGVTIQAMVLVMPDGKITVYRGTVGTLLFSSSNVMTLGNWYHIEGKMNIHPTTGFFEIRVNGSSSGWVPPQTAQNTRGGTANNYTNRWGIQTASVGIASNFDYDGIYVLDDVAEHGSNPLNDFIGDNRIEWKAPNGAGSSSAWTPTSGSNYDAVNDAPPNDAVYVSDSTPGNRDLYAAEDQASGTVVTAALMHRAVKSDAGARSIKRVVKSGATTDVESAAQALGTSIAYYMKNYPVDPNTGALWSRANLNAAEIGQETL